jgi:hypothetical protein
MTILSYAHARLEVFDKAQRINKEDKRKNIKQPMTNRPSVNSLGYLSRILRPVENPANTRNTKPKIYKRRGTRLKNKNCKNKITTTMHA